MILCIVCQTEITTGSKFFPLEKRKYCSQVCNTKGWFLKNKESRAKQAKSSHLKIKFGITLEDYNMLFEAQGGRCAICGEVNKENVDSKGRQRPLLLVDHHHESGGVRGLLCHHCNVGLGHFKDSPDNLMSAIDYLGRDFSLHKKNLDNPRGRLKCQDIKHELIPRSGGGVRCRTCNTEYHRKSYRTRKTLEEIKRRS